jgi:hypothetical protein
MILLAVASPHARLDDQRKEKILETIGNRNGQEKIRSIYEKPRRKISRKIDQHK